MIDNKRLKRAIKSGLTQTINEHGPITRKLIGSAIKRIVGAFKINTNCETEIIEKHKSYIRDKNISNRKTK